MQARFTHAMAEIAQRGDDPYIQAAMVALIVLSLPFWAMVAHMAWEDYKGRG